MDRFIGAIIFCLSFRRLTLKSNMDRFIEFGLISNQLQIFYLKSNMDRFIGKTKEFDLQSFHF